jgi:hypothetical protein
LTGLTLIAVAFGDLLGTAAGLMAGGFCLVLIGATTDDAQVTLAVKRGWGWTRYFWHRQILKETIVRTQGGFAPQSPQPPLEIDPEMQAMSERLAQQRVLRGDGKTHQGVP